MWWNILPSWCITGALVYVPVITCSLSAYIYTGSTHSRDRESNYHRYLIYRDKDVVNGGNPYRQHIHLGLDTLPDK